MAGLNQEQPHILCVEEFTEPAAHIRVSVSFDEGREPHCNIYLPSKDQWKGRFYQHVHPFLGIDAVNADLAFHFDSGAYSISVPQFTMGHLKQAAAAHVSRRIAQNYYDFNAKIYGYIYGGSGGSMQVIGAIEAATGMVWDGGVPFIPAASVSLGNFDVRWFARAVLQDKAPLIADAVKPGGSGDPFAVLNDMERDVLSEVTQMGIPLRGWENHAYLMGMHEHSELIDCLNTAGAVMKAPTSSRQNETLHSNYYGETNNAYTNAFWHEPGYLAAYDAPLRDLFYALRDRGVSEGALAKIAYHRHKDPGPDYDSWSHLRDADGHPLYAQMEGDNYAFTSNILASGGAQWSGDIKCKTIMVANLLDLDAFPTDAHYYTKRVNAMGRNDRFRIWYNDNADHHEKHAAYFPYLDARLIDYRGSLVQALKDLSAWVENDIEPSPSSHYSVIGGQIKMEENAFMRGGIQPLVKLTVNGTSCANVMPGEAVYLSASIQVPYGTGEIVSVAWDFLGTGDFTEAEFKALPDGSWAAETSHAFEDPGFYLSQIQVASQREGAPDELYSKVYNLGRARIIVATCD